MKYGTKKKFMAHGRIPPSSMGNPLVAAMAAMTDERPHKIHMRRHMEVDGALLSVLAVANPALVEAIYRHSLVVEMRKRPPREWLNENCSGFFCINDADVPVGMTSRDAFVIYFELEEDQILFRSRFEGSPDE